MLVDDRVLRLEDTVERWLPGLIPRGSEMTIEMLLSHRAGVYNHTELESFWVAVLADPARNWSSNEIVALVHDRTPTSHFGTFAYSNTGFYLLGMIVEAATGNTVSDEIDRRIFIPFDITGTRLTRQSYYDAPHARGYTMMPPDSGKILDTTDWNISWDWTAGAGISTGSDMLRLAAALFGGDILSAAVLEKMTTPTEPGGYGLGIGKVDSSVFKTTLIGHTGQNPGTATLWYYFPEYSTTIFVAVNRSDSRTRPDQTTVPVDGLAIASDIFLKAWQILRES